MKKSARPTSSAKPRAFKLPALFLGYPSGSHVLPDKKALVGVIVNLSGVVFFAIGECIVAGERGEVDEMMEARRLELGYWRMLEG